MISYNIIVTFFGRKFVKHKFSDFCFLFHVANSSVTNTSTMSTTISSTTVSEVTTSIDDINGDKKVLVPVFNESVPTESGCIKQEVLLQVIT